MALRTFQTGMLWQWVKEVSTAALASGALVPLSTSVQSFDFQGRKFPVRVLGKIERKEAVKTDRPKDFNPFLPPEPALTVCQLATDYLCVLNKFNVFNNHLLVVTKDFVAQTTPLQEPEFDVVVDMLKEAPAFVFYNGGAEAGASQRHRHLQVVPLPLDDITGVDVPLEVYFGTEEDSGFDSVVGVQRALPFPHRFKWLESNDMWQDPKELFAAYSKMLVDLGRVATLKDEKTKPYNLIVTRKWMMVVPRLCDEYEGIPVNGLAYGGGLLVKNEQQLELLKKCGVFEVLSKCAEQ